MVGDGRFAAAGDDPVGQMRDAGHRLVELAAAGQHAAGGVGDHWSGRGHDAAQQFFATAFSAVDDVGTRSVALAGRVGAAADAVALANTELQRIVDDFTATAHALEPGLPGTAGALMDAARRAVDDAVGVVSRLEDELDTHAAAVSAPTGPAAATPPAGATAAAPLMSALPALGGAAQGLTTGVLGAVSPLLGTLAGGVDPAGLAPQALLDPGSFGDGVAVRLPDGGTVMAPNAVAADAVRNALTQVGVPYQWGGTTPGVGLDCSGLTQWAYREAGLELPRLAQDQDVGAAVSPDALLPGDLAVWDGHVAMIVGNGMMVEAGDPVGLSPIRTTNLGQGFQGFWRPTA